MARPRVPVWTLDALFAADLSARGELQPLLDLVGRFAIFLDPRVVRAVPVVYPKTARIASGRQHQGQVSKGIRYWTNQPAEAAFFAAMGVNPERYTGHIVCHVYPGSPSSPQHFTNIANLFIVPTTLASFTEWGPVLAALQWRAFELYGYSGPAKTRPAPPAFLPRKWRAPSRLGVALLKGVTLKLLTARRERPMYIQPRRGIADAPDERAFLLRTGLPWWQVAAWTREAKRPRPALADGWIDLEQQFWFELHDNPEIMRLFQSWIVRHAYFAPPSVVAAVPNPFPKTRRFHPTHGEKEGDIVNGITMCINKPARAALIVALGHSIPGTRGALVNHIWADAPFLPEHFAHIGGLAIVPLALGSVVDADPIRVMLQRRAFERTGYAGPTGREPRRPRGYPWQWPENIELSPKLEARAIAKLERYRREIPGFYRKWRPGGPGRPPRR